MVETVHQKTELFVNRGSLRVNVNVAVNEHWAVKWLLMAIKYDGCETWQQ